MRVAGGEDGGKGMMGGGARFRSASELAAYGVLAVFFVGDVDEGGEGLLFGFAAEMDAVGEFVVNVAVGRVGGDGGAVGQDAEALFVEGGAGIDGGEGDGDGFGDAVAEGGEGGGEVALDVHDGAAGEFGGAAVGEVVGRNDGVNLEFSALVALGDDEGAADPGVDVAVERLAGVRVAAVVLIDEAGELAVLNPLGDGGAVALLAPGRHARLFLVHEEDHDGGGFGTQEGVVVVVGGGDEIVDGGESGAVAIAAGADAHEFGKDAIGGGGRDPRLVHDGERHEVAVAGDAFGGAAGAAAVVEHGVSGGVELHGADLLVVTLFVGAAVAVGSDEVGREYGDAVVEVAVIEELAEAGEVGGDAVLVGLHGAGVVDDKHEVHLAAAGAVGGDVFHGADRLDVDGDGVFDAELGVVFVDGVVAEAVLADEAGVGGVRELPGGAVEAGGAVSGAGLIVEEVGDFCVGDVGAIGRGHEVGVVGQGVRDGDVGAGGKEDFADVEEEGARGGDFEGLQHERLRGGDGEFDAVFKDAAGGLVAHGVGERVLAGVVVGGAVGEVTEAGDFGLKKIGGAAAGEADAATDGFTGDGEDQVGAGIGADDFGGDDELAVDAAFLGGEAHGGGGDEGRGLAGGRGCGRGCGEGGGEGEEESEPEKGARGVGVKGLTREESEAHYHG